MSVFCAEPLIYTGQTCRNELQERRRYFKRTQTGDNEIYIFSSINQSEMEENAVILANGLPLLTPSPECSEAFKDFLCLYMFSLCIDGEELRASRPECINVSSVICQKEWKMAVAILGEGALPSCTKLSNETGTFKTTGKIFHRSKLWYSSL